MRMEREEHEAKFKAKQEEEYDAKITWWKENKVAALREGETSMRITSKNASVWPNQYHTRAKGGYEKDNNIKQSSWRWSFSPQQNHTISHATINRANDVAAELVKVLAGAFNASRVPVPEPSIFSGDALRYSNWKLSFNTLIDQKNIPENENIFYLRRCVSGQAKSALDGYFLLCTETAYAAAWKILDERYGNPFSVAKAYRDKLQAWPKVSSRESTELRDFAVVKQPWSTSRH